MRLRSIPPLLALPLISSAADTSVSATASATATALPCQATSSSGAFYDLTHDVAIVEAEGSKHHKGAIIEDYRARGWDYGSNFTLNLCAPVVKPVKDVVGVDKLLWKNVSAYYVAKGKTYSLGQSSSRLMPRGRKLVLQYKDGSPCGSSSVKSKRETLDVEDRADGGKGFKHWVDEEDDFRVGATASKSSDKSKSKADDDDDDEPSKTPSKTTRRKSLTISFLCDRDPLNTVAAASFVATDPDECAYFFEVRSQHACAGAEPHKPGSVGPGSVFAIIFFIALLVYFVGGVMYQRTVAHARGWRQLPNYSLWAGIGGFLSVRFPSWLVVVVRVKDV
jgi:cation-dependent mannose-6-phosphate receptor